MKTLALAVAATVALAAALALSRAAAKTLDIYVIDVEGGQSTLIVTPARESVLIDTGFPSDGTFNSTPGAPATARDAQRILAAGRAAGLTRIDYLLTTHYHADHDGCATAARRTKRPGGGRPASDNGGSVTPQTPLMLPSSAHRSSRECRPVARGADDRAARDHGRAGRRRPASLECAGTHAFRRRLI